MSAEKQPEIRWLYRQVRPFGGLHAVRLLTLLVTSALTLVDPLILKWILDELIPWRKPQMLWVAALAFFVVYLFRSALSGMSDLLDFYAGQRVGFNVRLALLRHLQRLSADYHDNTSVGDNLHRLEQDVQRIQDLGGALAASVVRFVVTTALTLLVMLILSWKLTVVIVPLIPCLVALRRFSYPRLRESSDRVQQESARVTGFLQDHLAAITQVQLLGRERREARRFVRLSRSALSIHVRRRIEELAFGLFSISLIVAAIAFALGYGGYQVMAGAMSVGGLVAYYTYLGRFFEPLRNVVDLYSQVQRSNASTRRILEVLDREPSVADRPGALPLPPDTPGVVEFSGVTFAYHADKPVLQGISFRAEPGERIALVGESGSGKSTVSRLLARLYEPQGGSVCVDGADVRRIQLRSLRSAVAVVPQDPVLFDVTLRENLLYGNPHATEEELLEAIEMARLGSTVRRLPQGLLEPVGPRGARLSGGQRQRVAIARAILQRPRVLVLDEATSALDGPTERAVLESLEGFVRDRTTLLIAHRLSAIRWADRILVLDHGRIVEEGTDAELYRRGGLYRRLCEEQFRREEEPAAAELAARGVPE
ncbi:MAG TPA: ABC transporter ATP-binding protein [Thermoanaerobaculia bacterium]